jgi:hypothetical protein
MLFSANSMARNIVHRDPILTDLTRRPQTQLAEGLAALDPSMFGSSPSIHRVFLAKDDETPV